MNAGIAGISTKLIMILISLLVLSSLAETVIANETGHEHEHESDISLFSFIKPLGICALSLILITFGTGLFRRKLGRRFLKIHRVFAYSAVGLALCHGILVLALF